MAGLFSELRQNALNTLEERTQNKHQNLQMDMGVNWSSLSVNEQRINDAVTSLLAQQGETFGSVASDAKLNARIVATAAPELVTLIRSNNTTGVFLILDGPASAEDAGSHAGLYLRDRDVDADETNNGDLSVVRGPQTIATALGLETGERWQEAFTFTGGSENTVNDYYYKPLAAAGITVQRPAQTAQAQESPWAVPLELTQQGGDPAGMPADQRWQTGAMANPAAGTTEGYWSFPFRLNEGEDDEIITYSEPLVARDGTVYGVLGVEIAVSQLTDMLSSGEFAKSGQGSYYLGVTEDGGDTYRRVANGGEKYSLLFNDDEATLTPETRADDGWIDLRATRTGETVLATAQPLSLYADDSPFVSQQWTLIGLADEATLFAFERTIRRVFFSASLLAVLLGAGVAFLTGRRVVRPIVRLSRSLQTTDPGAKLRLAPTGILEIDRLADAITTLNHDAIESATRLSKILKLASLPIGVFEMQDDGDMAYCSDDVFTLLGHGDIQTENNLIAKPVCMNIVSRAMERKVEDSVYRLPGKDGERFVRIKLMREEHGIVGTVMDVTAEMNSRRRLEHELDSDLLTGILNRRAFENLAESLFAQGKDVLGIAAMIMLDLDNLKFLNDTYGHDCGDGYIRALADALRMFGDEKALVARRSGDEFYVFLYGGTSRCEVRERIEQAWKGIAERSYTLPDGKEYKMRASAGIAWYPDDAKTLSQLIRYADFAMYNVKRNDKGSMVEFNEKDYGESSYLISGRNALDRLIDGGLIRFMVQPILSARTGNTIGYELLMRTDEPELPTPRVVLKLASAEGKLQHIERLTWFKGLETAAYLLQISAVAPDTAFFLNSIANQALSREEEQTIENRFSALLSRVVVEVTEGERNDQNCTDQKIRFVKSHGGKIAIDDYGTGYNSELALVKIDADIVKLDISFVHDVDKDTDKQALIQNLISYARRRSISVLAEGVETGDEMRTLIRFGVDYLQGYYLGAPKFKPAAPDERLRAEIRRCAGVLND